VIRNPSLTEQLTQEIAMAISSGELAQDDGRLPPETELSRKYGVSRATVRDVLARLEATGAVVRRQGIGTFINGPLRAEPGMIWIWLEHAPSFLELISQSGFQGQCTVLSAKMGAAGEVAGRLNIPVHEEVVTIEKLFSASGIPIIYSLTTLAHSLVNQCPDGPHLTQDDYKQSTYQLLQNRCRMNVKYQTSEIRSIQSNATIAEHLDCEVGAPLFHVEEVGYSEEGGPLFYAVHHFRGERVTFRQIRIPTFTVESA
jgi:GntR family transcriptional regulator